MGKMMTNLIITALGVGSVLFLMKSDVRHGSAMLRRNVKTIRAWLEDEGASAAARSGCVRRSLLSVVLVSPVLALTLGHPLQAVGDPH